MMELMIQQMETMFVEVIEVQKVVEVTVLELQKVVGVGPGVEVHKVVGVEYVCYEYEYLDSLAFVLSKLNLDHP